MTQLTQPTMRKSIFDSRITPMALVAFVLIIASSPARAQWTTNGNNINNTNSGNVGIGTTTPSATLDVKKSQNAGTTVSVDNPDGSSSGAFSGFTFFQNGVPRAQVMSINDGCTSCNGGAKALQIWNWLPGNLIFATNATERMRIDATGKIGVGTTNPTRMLEVLATDGEAMRLYRNSSSLGWGVNLKFAFNNSSGSEVDYAGLHGVTASTTAGAEAGNLVFTTVNGGALTEKMRISSSGNVGIGTSSPGYKLDIQDNNTGAAGFRFGNASNGTTAQIQTRLENDVGYLAYYGVTASGYTSYAPINGGRAYFGGYLNDVSIFTQSAKDIIFSTNGTENLRIKSGGNVGIGTSTPSASYKLDVNGGINASGNINSTGNITAAGNIAAKYQDVAEWVESSQLLPAGTVVVLDQTKSNQVIASSHAYDTRVAGVISAQPGITLGEKGDTKVLVATTGRVKVKVDASAGPIQVGDLLVTSDIEGVAKKSEPLNLGGVQIHRPGTLIGKALEPLAKGTGEILVLLSLQ